MHAGIYHAPIHLSSIIEQSYKTQPQEIYAATKTIISWLNRIVQKSTHYPEIYQRSPIIYPPTIMEHNYRATNHRFVYLGPESRLGREYSLCVFRSSAPSSFPPWAAQRMSCFVWILSPGILHWCHDLSRRRTQNPEMPSILNTWIRESNREGEAFNGVKLVRNQSPISQEKQIFAGRDLTNLCEGGKMLLDWAWLYNNKLPNGNGN